MRMCKTCKNKFNVKENIKSLFNRCGSIECENCNSVFVLKKEGPIRWILNFMIILFVINVTERMGLFKGTIVALIVGIIGAIINLNIDSLYKLKS